MPFVFWDDQLAVGVPSIDEQHKKLLAIMNALAEEMQAQNGRQALGKALADLTEYTQVHFRFEENLIKSAVPEQFVTHMQEHQTLIARLNELQDKYDHSTTGILSIEALQFIRSWLLAHIAGSDKSVFRSAAQKKARARLPA